MSAVAKRRFSQLTIDVLTCLRCGGFIRASTASNLAPVQGCRLTRVLTWERADIIAFYSRVLEEFGSSRWVHYLLQDSLACTLAEKHKKRSRAAAYKLFGDDLGGFPMPSEERAKQFQTARPAPRWVCERFGGCPIGHRQRVVIMRESLGDVRDRHVDQNPDFEYSWIKEQRLKGQRGSSEGDGL
mmetsp:Transcript_57259/g.124399  ORF Transcript_57259/g.124399 Transcript_57259/m.124399 type:complete len:185 (-) Transcript_57259:257-811(-)